MASIAVGQRFDSLADFKKALRNWAIASNFTPSILDSDSRRVRAGCRTSEGCPFRIRCNFSSKNGYASVTTLEDVHTCSSRNQPGSQGIKRAEACKLKFLLEAVPQLMTVDRNTPTKAIIDAVKNRYGQEIAMRQAQKVKAILVPRNSSCALCKAPDHTSERCPNDPRASLSQQASDQDHSMMDADSTMNRSHEEVEEPQPPPPPAAARQIPSPPQQPRQPQRTSISHNFQQPQIQQQSNIQPQNTHRENSRPPIDPSIMPARNSVFRNSRQMSPQSQPATQAAPHLMPSSYQTAQETPSQQPPRDTAFPAAQDAKIEAARLMQLASQHMQEAGRLNLEAARLIASAT